jgi:predicted ribosome quality control (RQC) complex YloA/Tae2 family protein
MPFDGLVLAAIRQELDEKYTGARIEKIHQPGREELVLGLHRPGERQRLLLSAHAQNARIQLTASARENPATPPLFCMVLRKHLEGGRITGFEQPGLERVLVIRVDSRDELGRPSEKHLVCEFMGKHSNIILVDPVGGAIVDGIKRYSHAVSRHREVLPGRPYLPPPVQDKQNPQELDEEAFRQACFSLPLSTTLPNVLLKRLAGLSPVTCREIVFRTNLPPDTVLDQCGVYELRALWEALRSVAAPLAEGRFFPSLALDKKGGAVEFAALELSHYEGCTLQSGSMNEVTERFFTSKEAHERLAREKQSLLAILNKESGRQEKKLDIYSESLASADEAETLRLYGELLTANLYHLEKGLQSARLENYYDPEGGSVVVPLDEHLTPVENARVFFKKYSKAKSTREAVQVLATQAKSELEYIEGIKTAVELAGDLSELAEIRQELTEQGYLKAVIVKAARKIKKERLVPRPLSFLSTDGFRLYAGKNNKQNDHLTLKMARDEDLWLHVKDIPGAHVIIRTEGREVPPATLYEAACLAAYFSRAQSSKSVPVDYTQKKHVHKPKGARPGMVIYEHQKTVMAGPDEDLADKLADREP